MAPRLCPFCAEEIKPEAIKCKHCQSSLELDLAPSQPVRTAPAPGGDAGADSERPPGTLWLPVPSLVLGIVSVLALFDDSAWGMDHVVGLLLFSGTGLTLGIISVTTQKAWRGMAVAGIVLSCVGVVIGLGLLTMI